MRPRMLQYVKPNFINPMLKHVTLEMLQDKAVGMAFPLDSQYFFATFLSSLKENMFDATFYNTTNWSVHA